MAENYITQHKIWKDGQKMFATELNGNIGDIIVGLNSGANAINVFRLLSNSDQIPAIDENKAADFTALAVSGASVLSAVTCDSLAVDNVSIDTNTITTTASNLILDSFTDEITVSAAIVSDSDIDAVADYVHSL
jgi:hypothetical protein